MPNDESPLSHQRVTPRRLTRQNRPTSPCRPRESAAMDSLDHSSTELPPQDDLQQILRGPSPCDACRCAARCATSLEACEAFGLYVIGRSEVRWRTAPRVPTREQWQAIFEPPKVSTTLLRRLAKRSRRPILTPEQRRERWRLASRIRRARNAPVMLPKCRQ
jgi:hypothetical protein